MTAAPGEAGGTPAGRARITPLDIQQKEFRVSRFGGYRMRDVDEFLDQLTEVVSEMVEENARLRRQIGAAPVVGSPDLDDVARQADEIIQRARDEAARISAEARGSAVAATPSAGTEEERAAVKAFLQQERTFLQELAGLVQGHAETVKGMARSARREEAPDGAHSAAAPDEEPAVATDVVEVDEEGKHAAPTAAEDDEGPTERVVEIQDEDATQTLPAADDEAAELAQTRPAGSGRDHGTEGDASLRELFWGEGEDG
jgi:DivIVA domain-containing protein